MHGQRYGEQRREDDDDHLRDGREMPAGAPTDPGQGKERQHAYPERAAPHFGDTDPNGEVIMRLAGS